MASLNKLAIRGIRSFDDKNIAVIEFFNPVTVIVGHNGSGKTTIIECLKYATTGDQPPNTKGGAFVHDPNMANEKEVKAQVKLRFHAANGTRMLCVRNLSVSKKKVGLTFKTLEGILSVADAGANGKRGTISTKCAEMDLEMPHLLGVSKSVLENVIFCHQEDSYWPLSEPSILKKKFDDIFEATKYTKALDSIKSLRKERVAEQKAEKERLDSLSKEKGHADKLTKRVNDMSSDIDAKQTEYQETKKEYDETCLANGKFYDQSTHFREIYIKQDQLTLKKEDISKEIEEMRGEVKEIDDSDEALAERLQNFEQHIAANNQKLKLKQIELSDHEDVVGDLRKKHARLLTDQGQLKSDEQRNQENINGREALIRSVGAQYGLKGYEHTPLENDKVEEFCARIIDLQQRQNTDTETLQSEGRALNADFQRKLQKLRTELANLKLQRDNARSQITELQKAVRSDDAKLDAAQGLSNDLLHLQADMAEQKNRLEKLKRDFAAADYAAKIDRKTKEGHDLDSKKDALNGEFKVLSVQADTRARLEQKRDEVHSKTQDIKNTLQINGAKYRELIGTDPKVETMDGAVDNAIANKDKECEKLEEKYNTANKALQTIETTISNIQTQLIQKQTEMKAAERQLKAELVDYTTVGDGIKEATTEVEIRLKENSSVAGSSQVFKSLLKDGVKSKKCTVCDRHLSDLEMRAFEKYLKEQIQKTSIEKLAENADELKQWEQELERLKTLAPVEATRDRVKNVEIPALEQQKKEQELLVPEAGQAAEKAAEELSNAKQQQRDLAVLKQHAVNVTRAKKDINTLQMDITSLENELASTGSARTVDDVQQEIDDISSKIRALDREKNTLVAERERSLTSQRSVESEIHRQELRESGLTSQLNERSSLEQKVASDKSRLADLNARSKDLDGQLATAAGPIQTLEEEERQFQAEQNAKVDAAQKRSQELNRSVDRLDQINKTISDYTRQRRAKKLIDCNAQVEDMEAQISEAQKTIDQLRDACRSIEKEVHSSGNVQANLRANSRLRRLKRDVAKVQEDIDNLDLAEAAESKRLFEAQWASATARENKLLNTYSALGGEITSMRKQLAEAKKDLTGFKEINRRYTEQLVKVKMSDMANADLEKYAKALDNAIMKYHSLKMEEVNDTMRHLWNKTYQGTDIDGIKIRSEGDGGTTRRSYNYRVVMTKDQIEMDMRGRCSAGQKMLASIIIRLALADSFGQNCGILALDEPTNALDTENIDALAASLVDIINERKSHANFQLIVITHDENFLRKLGQSDVMEYYWRVSRDSRQKSVIEREAVEAL